LPTSRAKTTKIFHQDAVTHGSLRKVELVLHNFTGNFSYL